jgi:dephospho-CoA kinase
LNKWPGKYVIGVTGSIGTGKSVVRRMLEHLGAYGIDADALAHRAIAKGAPAYGPVVRQFGEYILDASGQIDRGKLGRLVFTDPDALASLEALIHPPVLQAVDLLIRRSSQQVIAVEAIKLLESGMAADCDAVWVVYSPFEVQLTRLMETRHMSEKDARQRISAQIPQESRFPRASVIIKNVSTFEDTLRQVSEAWQKYIPYKTISAYPVSKPVQLPLGEVNVQRAGPRQAAEIAEMHNRFGSNGKEMSPEKVLEAFGEKAFMLLWVNNHARGMLGWQVENLVARTTDVLIDPEIPAAEYLPILVREMERASTQLQCEVSLLFVPPTLNRLDELWNNLGYRETAPSSLSVLAWQEAAEDSMQENSRLFFKLLRRDRVLKPI